MNLLKSKVPLLFFSGGVDSTLLLTNLIEKGPVDIVSQELSSETIVQLSHKHEKKARKNILKYLEKNHPKYSNIRSQTVVVSTNFTLTSRYVTPISQMAAMLEVVCAEAHSEVILGYLADDSWSHLVPAIQETWNGLQKLYHGHSCSDSLVPLRFPLHSLGCRKKDTIARIDSELLKLCWWCECPQDEEEVCGLCDSCISHKAACFMNQEKTRAKESDYLDRSFRKFRPNLEDLELAEKIAQL